MAEHSMHDKMKEKMVVYAWEGWEPSTTDTTYLVRNEVKKLADEMKKSKYRIIIA